MIQEEALKKRMSKYGFLLLIFFISCQSDDPAPATIRAHVSLSGLLIQSDSTYTISEEAFGTADFIQEDSIISLTINLENFPPNTIHAVHIHNGSCEQPFGYWNMGFTMMEMFCNKRSLGIPWAKPTAGDVGNVSVGYQGSGSLVIKTDLWRIGSGDSRDVTGKVLVIHKNYEDFTAECDPSHGHDHTHTNQKVACGSIVMVQ